MALPPQPEKPAPPDVLRAWLVTGAAATAIAALAALLHSGAAALGVVLGGAAGTAAFGLMARQMSGLRGPYPELALRRIYLSVLTRLALYGIALLTALALDRSRLRAFAGAVAGILLVRTAVVIVGAVQARRRARRFSSGAEPPADKP